MDPNNFKIIPVLNPNNCQIQWNLFPRSDKFETDWITFQFQQINNWVKIRFCLGTYLYIFQTCFQSQLKWFSSRTDSLSINLAIWGKSAKNRFLSFLLKFYCHFANMIPVSMFCFGWKSYLDRAQIISYFSGLSWKLDLFRTSFEASNSTLLQHPWEE